MLAPLLTAALAMRLAHQDSALAAAAADVDTKTSGVLVMRVYYRQVSDIDMLYQYDVWEFNDLANRFVLVSGDSAILNELRAQGWRVEIDQARTAGLLRSESVQHFAAGYRTVDELYTDMAAINATYPALTELVDYGNSYCKSIGSCVTPGGDSLSGYDLLAMRVTNEAIGGSSTLSGTTVISGTKPVLILLANIHAREITTPELAMRFLAWLVNGHGLDANATWLVDWHETWIVPTANPDGHWLVELGEGPPYNSGPFFQRKNADRSYGCTTWVPTPYDQYGVDLNRNHSFAWGVAGTSTDPCSQTFRGPSAASEPEVDQLQLLVRSLVADQRGTGAAADDTAGIFLTLHSFSELILWPWGHTSAPAPNQSGLKAIGDRMAVFNGYTSCQPGSCLYQASGTSDDWAYGELGIPAFTFEVGTEFMPPYDEIDNVQWPDNGPAFQYAAAIARAPYQLVHGPVASEIALAYQDGTLQVSAVIDDQHNGGKNVAGAVLNINTPYWSGDAISLTLPAKDGAFDSFTETVTVALDVTSLSPGLHMVFIRGLDSNGNWGAVNAAFFSVADHSVYFPVATRK